MNIKKYEKCKFLQFWKNVQNGKFRGKKISEISEKSAGGGQCGLQKGQIFWQKGAILCKKINFGKNGISENAKMSILQIFCVKK